MLKNVQTRLKKQKIEVQIDQKVKDLIAKQGVNKDFGARPLRRTIQNLIEDNLAEAILDGKGKKNIILTVENEKIIVKG